MTVYESQDAVQAVMGSILEDPITQAYFATFTPVALQYATSTIVKVFRGGWGGCGICCVDREHLNDAADVSLSQQRRSALSSVRPAVVGRKEGPSD